MSNAKEFLHRFDELECSIKKLELATKKVLNFNEARAYLGFSSSHLYKLTSQNRIKHSKPDGKLIFFKKKDLDTWMLKNPINTKDEVQSEAASFKLTQK